MKVVERRLLRGPNIHATRPVFLAEIDLQTGLKMLVDWWRAEKAG